LQPAVTLLEKFDAFEAHSAPMIRHEHGGYKYRVIEREKKPIDWHKVKNVRNWDDYIHSEKFKGIVRKVELHDGTKEGTLLLIYSGPVVGDTEEELIFLARQSCDLLAAHLQEKFGMRLDLEHPKPIRPEVGEWTPDIPDIAVKGIVAENGQVRTKGFNMDNSHHTGGEIDFKGKRGAELAKRYVKAVLETPQLQADIKGMLKKVEDKLGEISSTMTKIEEAIVNTGSALAKITDTLTNAIGGGSDQPPKPDPRRYT